jgi:RNA polymerase sigma-32 factor
MARTFPLTSTGVDPSLSRYLEEVRRFPVLQPQEEFRLAKLWRERHDRDAARILVTSHLRLVAKLAMRFRGYGLPISDVISEGNIGLMQAVKRFEPEKGFRFSTYAMWWIKAAIQEYVMASWSLVKLGTTPKQKRLFYNLRKVKLQISALHEGELGADQTATIARRLGVDEHDVVDMNCRLSGDISLNAPIRDGDTAELQESLVSNHESQENVLAESDEIDMRRRMLFEALSVLNERERRIFEARRLVENPKAFEALSKQFHVSRERVRQIEARAFEKVKHSILDRISVTSPKRTV